MATNKGAKRASTETVVKYKECLHTHPAPDGCSEFEPSGEDGTPESVFCAVCHCNRKVHRMVEVEVEVQPTPTHPPPRIRFIFARPPPEQEMGENKKQRTKITAEQKERLKGFAERVGWRVRKEDEEEIRRVCSDVGITRDVLKNWVSNNKRRYKNGESSSTSY